MLNEAVYEGLNSKVRVNTCLFCRDQIRSLKRGEHLIPESLGGWLKTEHVCVPCNSYFGSAVDIIANDKHMILLRREAGLRPSRAIEGEYFDQDLGQMVFARSRRDGTLERVRPVHQVGNEVFITAPTPELAQQEAERLKGRLEKRGKTITDTPVTAQDRRVVNFGFTQDLPDNARLMTLLSREAAKIAVEYIAYISSPAVALGPELDALRRHAVDGEEIPDKTVGVTGPREIWLPRTRNIVRRRSGPDDQASRTALSEPTFEMTPPPGIPHLTSVRHAVGVWKDHEGARFVLELFSMFRAVLPLNRSLAIRWGRVDFREFSQPKTGTWYV